MQACNILPLFLQFEGPQQECMMRVGLTRAEQEVVMPLKICNEA